MRKLIITSGYFNPLHMGHINYLEAAKKLGDVLVVIVNNDKQVEIKGSTPFMTEEERMAIVRAIRCVDEVFLSIDEDGSVSKSIKSIAGKKSGLELLRGLGGDRNYKNIPESEKEVCKKYNIKIINGVGGDKVQSSSWLLRNASSQKGGGKD